ncbi:hypothetical protein MPH_13339, partial [Macrophomina phaseolina MS6]
IYIRYSFSRLFFSYRRVSITALLFLRVFSLYSAFFYTGFLFIGL